MSKLLVVVDMQYDFVMPDGALYVPGAEKLLVPMIQHVFSFDRQDVVFTRDTHHSRAYSTSVEAKEFPPHCLWDTKGHELLIPFRGSDRIDKTVFDVWADERCKPYLEWRAQRYDEIEIVGVAADYCVRYAYEGFKQRGFNVTVRGDLTVGIKENPFQ